MKIKFWIFTIVIIFLLGLAGLNIDFKEDKPYKKMSKQAAMHAMAEQEFEMTRDPQTNKIPRGKIYDFKKQLIENQLKSTNTLNWEERGPDNFGGRTRAIVFDPKDPSGNTIWAGGVAGGLWKLTNALSSDYQWEEIKTYTGNAAISSIAIDPNDSDLMYVGTGEGWFNGDAYTGDGVYRSVDGGVNWERLESTNNFIFRYVQRVLVSGDKVFACTRDGGIQVSRDRGETWVKALGNGFFGFSERAADLDLAGDGTLYACMGFGSSDGLYISKDNGDSWEYIELPGYLPERMELDVSKSDPNVVYILKANASNAVEQIAKTSDGGKNWEILPAPSAIGMDWFSRNQAWYDLSITIDPTNPNRLFIGGVDLLLSEDGGETWEQISQWFGGQGIQYVHADQHNAMYLPGSEDIAMFSNDGGVYITTNASSSMPDIKWKGQDYNTIQFYACALHPTDENWFLGGTQDNGSHLFQNSGMNSTFEVTGGDGAYCHIDRDDPNIQITSNQNASYHVTLNSWASSNRYFVPGNVQRYFINPTDYDDVHDCLLTSANNGKVMIVNIYNGNLDSIDVPEIASERVTAIKAHPTDPTKIYVGSNSGKVVRIDSFFQNNQSNELLHIVNGNVRNIDVDLNNPDRIMFTVSNFNSPSVFVSEDDGDNWANHSGDIPAIPKRWGLFNPTNPNSILMATELGVWSTNELNGDATEWFYNSTGMAPTRVDMMDLRPMDNLVLAATHGRGMYTANLCAEGVDNDNDGVSCLDDCNDFDPNVNMNQDEIPYNGIDDDCDPSTPDDDLDGDGFALAQDCNDEDANINPNAIEIAGNGIDENCDDLDELLDCNNYSSGPWDIFAGGGNCFNGPFISSWQVWSNEAYYVSELTDGVSYFFDFCNGYDDALFSTDIKIFSYNSTSEEMGVLIGSKDSCRIEFDYVNNVDFPDVIILVHDSENCNALSNVEGNGQATFGCLSSGIDADGDGFTDEIDCDDMNADINPGMSEVFYNDIDDDCDPNTDDDDADGDGYDIGEDCDDTNPDINPGEDEILFNGIDEDCDPSTLDNDIDGDGYGLDVDCDETNPDINPGATEIPGNGIDENCDGLDFITAVHEIDGISITLFPNPTSDYVFIKKSALINYVVNIFDLEGRLVSRIYNSDKIDLSNLHDGIYLINVVDKNSGKGIVERVVLSK